MKSIQTKFIILIISGLITTAFLISAFSSWVVNKVIGVDSEIILNETCKEQTLRLDQQLKMVERAVQTIYSYAQGRLGDYEQLKAKSFRESYEEDVRNLSLDISNATDGAIAVYFRYNPEIDGNGKEGFFWERSGENSEFAEHEITDILAYSAEDEERVGWYYIPVQCGEATWLEPYYNKNLDVEMISYVIPFYSGEKLVGVIGMDVDFSIFVNIAQNIKLYNTGRAELVSITRKKVYYSEGADGTIKGKEISDVLYDKLDSRESTSSLIEYTYREQEFMVSFRTLGNQMKLIVFVPISEINEERNLLIYGCIILVLAVLGLIIFVAVYITRRIVHPLRELTVATERFAKGDWNISIECYTRDEVKRLTDSITKMAERTQTYIKEINSMAYLDGLTGVKNKACYINYVEVIKEKQKKTESMEYAVLVLDVNSLKWVNDTYGHEEGDQLIVAASRQICDIFSHSPVFRLGGDEFAVILTENDYQMRYKLLHRFRESMEHNILNEEKCIMLSVASGLASYPADGEDYDTIFKAADERMYQNKTIMKHGERPR